MRRLFVGSVVFLAVALGGCGGSSGRSVARTTTTAAPTTTTTRPDPTPEMNQIIGIINSVLPLVEQSKTSGLNQLSDVMDECIKATVEIGDVGTRMFREKLN